MANDVWALAEINNGKLAAISLQLASKADELAKSFGGASAAVALGTNTQAGAQAVNMTFQGGGTHLLGARPNAFATNRVGGTATVENVPAPGAPAKGAKVSGPFGTEGAEEAGHLGKAPDGHDIWMPAAARAK